MKLLFLAALFLTACTGRTNRLPRQVQAERTAAPEIGPRTDTANIAATPATLLDSVEGILDHERWMRNELIALLEHSTPPQADSLFISADYHFFATPAADSLLRTISPLVERSCGGGEPLPSDSAVIARLLASGIAIESVGEGEVEPRTERYYYYRIFRPYLTPETERFARLWADNDTQFYEDAGMVPTIDELYCRCLRWEEFLNDYPHSDYRPQVSEQYNFYMENLLFCTLDNTPTFDWMWEEGRVKNTKIENYWLEELLKLEQYGRESRTYGILEQYLTALAAQDYCYSDDLKAQITLLFRWMDPAEGL